MNNLNPEALEAAFVAGDIKTITEWLDGGMSSWGVPDQAIRRLTKAVAYLAAAPVAEPVGCTACGGTGTMADYVGDGMRVVETACYKCHGSGHAAPQPALAPTPADKIIGEIEALFPNWRSYRDLIDCITCTLHDLRGQPAVAPAAWRCRSAISPCSWQRRYGMDSICPTCVPGLAPVAPAQQPTDVDDEIDAGEMVEPKPAPQTDSEWLAQIGQVAGDLHRMGKDFHVDALVPAQQPCDHSVSLRERRKSCWACGELLTPALQPTADREALADFLCSEFDPDFSPCHGYQWPEHKDDDGYRGGGYVKLQPSDVQARAREFADRILKFLSPALSAPSAGEDGWRDMDSAPRDGTIVLVVCANAQSPRVNAGWWHDGWWHSYRPVVDKFQTENPFRWLPTHWRPFPAAPLTKGAR